MKSIRFRVCLFANLLLIVAGSNLTAAPDSSPRERLLLDFGWKFHLGNEWGIAQSLAKAGTGSGPASTSFSDASWRAVNLPHDWAVELPFDQSADGSHGFKIIGHDFPQNSVAWYRRTFELPKTDEGKRLWLEFDGVFRDCEVFVNGWHVGHHESGYSSFRCDITAAADYGGKNVIAVKVDASQFEGWFYEGAGIYRHVWLVKTAPVAIAPDGIFVYSKFKNNMPEDLAVIHIQTELHNSQTNSVTATLKCEIVSPDGELVGKTVQPVDLESQSEQKIKSAVYLFPTNSNIEMMTASGEDAVSHSPVLWSPESPKLYRLTTMVESDGKVVDQKETEFGIRTVAFDPNKGFLLNGRHYELKGTCNHQDAAGIGAALSDRLQYFRIAKLKEMGINAYRTSHNPPTPELLEACDRLGMLVLDETRRVGLDPESLGQLQCMMLRDRNHPSVFLWSLGNEEPSQGTTSGAQVMQVMQNLAHQLDPTRQCTVAMNAYWGDGFSTVIDVQGFNYEKYGNLDAFRSSHPNKCGIGTEVGSTVTTRGIYSNDIANGYVASYDLITTNGLPHPVTYGQTAERWWPRYSARPWIVGGFIWTGFDYRGEPIPYGWPCINSHSGIMDTCGFPKDIFYYYQSWWTDKPVLHLLPHWNWPGKEGQPIDVWCFSNCREVELFLNGKSLGRKTMERNSHLEWMVKYEPGTLSAKGYNDEGKLIAETKVETTGEPAVVQLEPDRTTINADGEDVSIITVSMRDARNRIVPTAMNLIHFDLSGPGKILGVGNGDPSCHEPDVYLPTLTTHTVALNDGWRWKKVPSVYDSNLPEIKTDFDDSRWETANPQSASGPLQGPGQAVFRAIIQVTGQELASESVELCFGMIDDDGWVYVNGQKVGESHDRQAAPVFDVKRLLHPGGNIIAVAVANWDNAGGINKGVTLRLGEKPEMPQWKRSVFNGLAQIVVQSAKTPGQIKLTANEEGLSPATVTIQSQPSTPRPCVP